MIYALEERCRIYHNKITELNEIIEQKNIRNRTIIAPQIPKNLRIKLPNEPSHKNKIVPSKRNAIMPI